MNERLPERGRLNAALAPVRFVWRHPKGVAYTIFCVLVGTVVLQNLEPTTVDVLFWSIARLPKLLVFVSFMVVGIVLWESGRALIRARSRSD